MRIVARLVRDESGVALVMALILMFVLAGLTAALLLPGAVNQRTSLKSADAQQSFALAEAALAYGEGAVYASGQTGQAPPSTKQTIPQQAGGGTGTWIATEVADGCNCTWSISATGTVDGLSRTVSAVATQPSSTTITNQNVWNYLYADSTAGTCPTDIAGGTSVAVPFLARGNVCIEGGSTFTGAQLYVGGNLTVKGGSTVGSSSKPISDVEIAGTPSSTACTLQPNSIFSMTPGTSYCNGKQFPLYASKIGTTIPPATTPQMPCIGQPSTLDPQCTGTNDGTWSTLHDQYNAQAALAKSGCPTNFFDNDTSLNKSLTTSNLTNTLFPQSGSYDCKAGSNEIKYSATGGVATLFVNGTFYFDGSLSLGSGLNIVYSGQATLYFTGGVTLGGGASFCGITNCTTSWNPSQNGIIFIAGCWNNSTGTSLITSSPCTYVTGGAHVQVGVYSTEQYSIDGGGTNMGPVLANNLNIGGGSSTLIPFTTMPPGTPLNSQTNFVPAAPPSQWSG